MESLDHVGIAVSDIDAAMRLYGSLFNVDPASMHRESVAAQHVTIASFVVGNVRLELTAPTSDESPIAKFIQKRGEGIHHIAFKTPDVQHRLDRLADDGVRLINTHPVPGAHDMFIAFLHPQSTGGVLMELCQPRTPLSATSSVEPGGTSNQ